MKPLCVYGSGDKGSAELVSKLLELKIPYYFMDIRVSDHGVKGNLIKLARMGLQKVPQVWSGDGAFIGDFHATMNFIDITREAALSA